MSNADAVLEQAIGMYDQLLILGWDKEGNLDIRATTDMSTQSSLWTVEAFKTKLLNGDFSG